MKKNFALIGVGGFIAPRHLKAIKETNNNLVAALDKSDSVGILDSHFPDVPFFLEFERFDRHLEKLRRKGSTERVHFVSVCSPNYLHDAHIRAALRIGADAICEKPLVLNPWNVDALSEMEQETGKRVYNILQLRLHPTIVALKKKIDQSSSSKKYEIDLTYITSRGPWYLMSWKGDLQKSGGITTNIGIHFFDMLLHIFGPVELTAVHDHEATRAAGYLELRNARVRWFLSIDHNDLPEKAKLSGQRTYRSLTIDGEELEFSNGFNDLHTLSYEHILAKKGFGPEEARPSIELVYSIRNSPITLNKGEHHPFLLKHKDIQLKESPPLGEDFRV